MLNPGEVLIRPDDRITTAHVSNVGSFYDETQVMSNEAKKAEVTSRKRSPLMMSPNHMTDPRKRRRIDSTCYFGTEMGYNVSEVAGLKLPKPKYTLFEDQSGHAHPHRIDDAAARTDGFLDSSDWDDFLP